MTEISVVFAIGLAVGFAVGYAVSWPSPARVFRLRHHSASAAVL